MKLMCNFTGTDSDMDYVIRSGDGKHKLNSLTSTFSLQETTKNAHMTTEILDGIPPQIQTNGSTVAKTSTNIFPVLGGSKLALFSLIMKPNGIREPHWHHNCSELGYVLDGMARLIILNPEGTVDTFEFGPGEIYFVPTGFFHYIENIDSSKNMHFAIFFGSDTAGHRNFRIT